MIGFFIAIISGALMSIQGVFNTQLTKTVGMWVSNGWVQFTALLLCVAAWFFNGRDSISAIMKTEPKYVLLMLFTISTRVLWYSAVSKRERSR